MKKRTKKKLAKFGKKASLGILKLLILYPARGIWWLSKNSYSKIVEARKQGKKRSEQKQFQEKRPKNQARFSSLNEIKNKQGDFSSFENKLLKNKSTIGIILGARGTGKSAIGMRLLENFKAKTAKRIYALGFKEETLPSWIKVINDLSQLENGAIILIDESGIEFSSRKAMTSANKLLSDLLLISRHKDISVIFISQSSANLEINAIRQADYLILKPSSLLQKDFERKKIKDIYQKAEKDFNELKGDVGLTYIYADVYCGFVSNDLPSFWSEKVSKGYGK